MHLYDKGEISINDEDKEGMMYNLVLDSLVESGFEHYEISNFCKDNLYSHHNVVYWTNKDYLGLGAGAHSLLNDKRYYNVSSVKKYIENVESGDLKQTSYERNALQEELMMGLRLLKGVNVSEINKKYNIDLFTKYDKLNYFINENLLQLDKGYLHFTKKGLFVGNVIFGHFLEG
jgi:oxygen-independent coproporphyrinogen-3 oxidase